MSLTQLANKILIPTNIIKGIYNEIHCISDFSQSNSTSLSGTGIITLLFVEKHATSSFCNTSPKLSL